MLNSTDTEHASLSDLSARLVCELLAGAGRAQDQNAVVDEVREVRHDHIDDLTLAVAEETVLLLAAELVDDGGEEVEGVWLV